jgi:hypothetical protein
MRGNTEMDGGPFDAFSPVFSYFHLISPGFT